MSVCDAGHTRPSTAGGGCQEPAVPAEEEAGAGGVRSQEGHRGPGTERAEVWPGQGHQGPPDPQPQRWDRPPGRTHQQAQQGEEDEWRGDPEDCWGITGQPLMLLLILGPSSFIRKLYPSLF